MATTIDIDVPHLPKPTFAERFAAWAVGTSRTVQLSRMIRALAQLNDEQLAKVGLTRSEIPNHAYRIVYRGA